MKKNSHKFYLSFLLLLILFLPVTIFAQLSGTKTIGGTTPDYATIKDAIKALNTQGVTSPGVTFLIRGGTYAEDSLRIRTSTSSVSAPIIFKPDVGSTVVINVSPPNTTYNFAIKIDTTQYVTIDGSNNGTTSRDLTINSNGTSGQRGIWVSGASHFTTIKNCNVNAGKDIASPTTSVRCIDFLYTGVGQDPDNIICENNFLRYAYFGVRMEGNAAADVMENAILRNNFVDSVANSGIYSHYQNNSLIYNNDVNIRRGSSATMYGIYVGTVSSNVKVYSNKVYDLNQLSTTSVTYGIYNGASSTTGINSIYNNFVRAINLPATGTGAMYGIYGGTGNTTTPDVFAFNTVYLTGASTGNRITAAFYKGSSTGPANVYNNIFFNTRTDGTTGVAVAIYKTSTGTVLTSNNNNLYVGTPDAQHYTGRISTTNYATIADWRTANSSDAQSFTENTPFISTTDLHIQTTVPTQIESGGVPVAGITNDIDGDVRNGTTPDIGGDEFAGIALDLTPPSITFTPLAYTSSTSARTLNSAITDPGSGVPIAGTGLPVLYWRINSGTWNSAQATYLSGSNYQFTFGSGVATGDTVKYYICAQDGATTPNVTSNPLAGAGGFTANPPAAATPPTTPASYIITNTSLSGDYTVGILMFNSMTGRNIYFEKVVQKVMKEVVVETDAVKGVEYTETSPTVNGVKQLVEVEEISWIPMENGQVFEGDLFVKKAENPSLDFPEGIDGVYLTLTAAITDLNLRGVGGATTFLLTDATYPTETFPMIINVLSENKPTAVNTVTIKPNTAVTASISGPSAASQLLRILNSHIIIDGSNSGGTTRNLTFENTSVTTPQVILIGSLGTTPIINVTVKNCNIINGVNTSTPLIVSDGNASGTAGWFNNITIQNNTIQKAYIGSYSIAVVSAGNGSGLSLLSNDLTTSGANSVRFVGLYLQGIDGANVSGNQIANFDGVTGEDDRGIWLATGTINTVVQRNRIYSLKYTGTGGYGAYGAAISTGTLNANNSFINNVVYDISGDGWGSSILGDNPHGIYLFSTQTGIKVYYNSIYLYGNTLNRAAAISTGITLGTGTTADIKDNVIVNNLGALTTLGLASIGIYVQSAATQLEASNYNDIWIDPSGTISKFIGQIGATGYATLLEWQTASTQDANSISANPLFVSNTDLRPSETSPLLLAATPIAGITTDILGATRNATTPTIGAYEMPFYVPLSGTYTVGLSAFLQATGKKIYFETRTRTVRKDLLAEDTNIDLLAYDEKENGSQQPVIDESQRYITVTEEYLEMMENGKPFDQSFFSDNTLGIYPTITAAVTDLKLRGVAGPVTFLLVDTNYPTETYPIDLIAYAGASATNTVTFKPATGIQAVIPGSTTQTTATLRLNTDGQYYIIDGSNTVSGTTRDLSIIAPAVVPAVHFFSNGSNNVVKNCIIQSQQTSTGSGSLILAAGTASSNNLIDNCLFQPVPSAAVYAIGVYLFSSTLSSNNTISNNEFLNFSARGITMQGAAGVNGNKAVKNLIHQTTPSTATTIYGFYLGRGKNNVVEGNVINNLQSTSATATQYGMYYIGASGDTMNIKIFNNVISLSAGVNQTAGTIRGIDYFGYAANSAEIYYNTVYIGGSNVTAGTTAALAKRDDALNFIVKDNTFNNARSNISGTGIHYAVQYTDTVTTLLDMNYNHYYASGNGGVFGIYATTTTANLAAWQTRTSQDANSISNDPIFVSNLDYRPQAVSPLLAAGLTISGITTDILGALRGTPPTIGAYENGVFVAINSPSNLAAIPDTFTVDLSWQDNSNNEFAFVIQRKLGDSLSVNPWNNIDTVNANVINYLDTGLSANTMYSYRVFGYNSSGNSGFSNIVTTTTFIPVELTAFTAEVSGREILVSWSTATELNNRGFDIERNMNGEWEKIGFKDGRGTTTTESSYSFIDKFTYESFVGTITYRLKQMDFDGTYAYSPEVEVNVDFTPKEYTLYQNYPNPFNPVTTIKYSLPFESNVRIAVYNILGEMLDVLVDETKAVGFHDFNWNASNLASGIYIYTIEAKSVGGDKNYSSVKKMILMK